MKRQPTLESALRRIMKATEFSCRTSDEVYDAMDRVHATIRAIRAEARAAKREGEKASTQQDEIIYQADEIARTVRTMAEVVINKANSTESSRISVNMMRLNLRNAMIEFEESLKRLLPSQSLKNAEGEKARG